MIVNEVDNVLYIIMVKTFERSLFNVKRLYLPSCKQSVDNEKNWNFLWWFFVRI